MTRHIGRALLVLLAASLGACGVAQDKYDDAVTQLKKCQDEGTADRKAANPLQAAGRRAQRVLARGRG